MKQINKRNIVRILLATLAVAVIASLSVYAYWRHIAYSAYDGESDVWIYIPENSTPEYVEQQLTSLAGDAGKNAVKLSHWHGDDLSKSRGAYKVAPGTPAIDIFKAIAGRRQTPVKLTFNNLRTIDQLASRVASRLETDSASFIRALDSILPSNGFNKASYIAAFLPDTYEFYWTATPAKVVDTLLKYRNRFWNDERRAKAKAMGLTPVQIATIASIAEEETNNKQERGIVGRLYINRVNKRMPLQADPTVKFAVGDFSLRRITQKHLNSTSPYNTYKFAGLPPGPIRMPEAATLDAVLNSKPHNYIYMCAKEDFSGRHNFTSDYATHQKNATKYRQELNKRNIK